MQRRSQSFHRTTKQERMQKYYEHFLTKYSGRTSLEAISKSQRKSSSPLPMSYGSIIGNMRGNNMDLIQMRSLSTPRAPIQRIGNFSYPRRVSQSRELTLNHISTTAVCHDESIQHNHPFRNALGASECPKYHGRFSGNSLPKWNRLYRAYSVSS